MTDPRTAGWPTAPTPGAGARDPPPPQQTHHLQALSSYQRGRVPGQAAATRGCLYLQAFQAACSSGRCGPAGPVGRARHFLQPLRPSGPRGGMGVTREQFSPSRRVLTSRTGGTDTILRHRTVREPTRSGSHFPTSYAWHHLPALDTQNGPRGRKAVKVRNGENTETF